VIEEVPGLEHLRVAPEEPTEEVLPGSTRPDAHLLQRRLEGFVIAEAPSAERLLDRVVEVVALELCDPSSVVAPHAGQAEDLSFAHPGTEQHGDEPDEAQVLLAHVLFG
jgi:hypothetical protein